MVGKEGYEGPGQGQASATTVEAYTTDFTTQYPGVGPSAPPVYPHVPNSSPDLPVDGFPIHHPQTGSYTAPHTQQYPTSQQYPQTTSDPASYQPLLGPQPVPDMATVIVYSHSYQPPERVMCSRCQQAVIPEPHLVSGLCTWLVAGGLCMIGCWPLACVPFCCAPTKDTLFVCSRCGSELYRLKRAPL